MNTHMGYDGPQQQQQQQVYTPYTGMPQGGSLSNSVRIPQVSGPMSARSMNTPYPRQDPSQFSIGSGMADNLDGSGNQLPVYE